MSERESRNGSANKEIAAELFISESTAKSHIANIF
jgi:DNA-binding NarL/FixJ family response regulator